MLQLFRVHTLSPALLQYKTDTRESIWVQQTHKHTAAMAGSMGWQPEYVKQLIVVSSYWIRLIHMSNTTLNKKVYLYCLNVNGPGCKNCFFEF